MHSHGVQICSKRVTCKVQNDAIGQAHAHVPSKWVQPAAQVLSLSEANALPAPATLHDSALEH